MLREIPNDGEIYLSHKLAILGVQIEATLISRLHCGVSDNAAIRNLQSSIKMFFVISHIKHLTRGTPTKDGINYI